MNLFGGLGKAGAGVLGGAVKGAGKVVETAGEAATGVVEGTGKVIGAVGDAIAGKKAEKKPKRGLKEIVVEQINEDFGIGKGKSKEGDDYDEELDMKEGDEGQEAAFDKDEDFDIDNFDRDEAEKKLMKFEDGAAVEESDEEEDETSKVIPKNFSLKSLRNNKYLRYINEGENSDGLLRYSSKNIVGPYSKLAVRASKDKPGFIHIRCCYNNKFWVRLSEDSKYIAAIANEEEEDESKWSCTLFEPYFLPEKNACYIRHVQLNSFLCLAEGDSAPYNDCLVARVEDISTIDENLFLFSATDWDSIFVLPKYVAFKSNNGEYLEPSGKYLKFSASNVEDPAVVFEVIAMEDGYVRMKHARSGKYWIRDPNWIWCQSIDTEKNDPNTLFWPVKVDNNVVAFRNKGNNRFCKRLTTEGKTNCLNAAVSTITDTARLEVSEVVVARSMDNVEYRLNDSRVYGKKILTVSKGVAINNTEVADHVTLKFRYEKKVERTWSSSVSMTVGMAARFKSKVPTVATMKFELSFSQTNERTMEETEKEKSFEEISETITIPAMSKVKFGAVVSEARCDVPFTYIQRDTLKDGKQVTHRFEDGIFSGVTTYDYKFETEKLAL